MAIPVWFDTAHYKAQKLAQLTATDSNGAWTAPKLDSVMESAGFSGNEGWFAHFTQYGADEHCSPNATFNAAEYLTAKLAQLKATDPLWNGKSVGDVQAAFKAAGLGEWEHYHKYGMAEGLNPSNAFDELAYLDAKLVQLVSTDPTNWTGKTALDVRTAFQTAGLSALEHFMLYGKAENLVAIEVPADKQVTVPSDFHVFGGQGGMPSAGFDLTRGSDNLTGTAGNDSFFAANANGFQTLNVTDTLNGGAGEDTLYIGTGAGAANFAGASIKSIEKVVSTGSVDVSANADVLNVTIQGGGLATTKMAQAVILQDSTAGNGLGVAFVDANGKEDAVSVDVKNNTDMSSLFLDNIEKLTLNLTGKNVRLDDNNKDVAAMFSATGVKELLVTGEGSIKLVDGALTNVGGIVPTSNVGSAGSISLLDFSANKGGVELGLDYTNLNQKAVTVKGGVGKDAVTAVDGESTANIKFDVDMGAGDDKFQVVDSVKKDSVIKGGEGTDTLVLSGTFKSTSDFGKMFTEFETALLKGTAIDYTDGHFKSVSKVVVEGTSAAENITLRDVSSVEVTGSGSGDAVAALNMSAIVTNVTFDNGATGQAAEDGTVITNLNLTGTTLLEIHSLGNVGEDNILTTIDDTASGAAASATTLSKVTIDGDQDLTIGGFAFTGTSGAASVGEINAKDFTGDLTVTLTGAKADVKVVGGSGDDEITTIAGNYLAKLTGGEGNDIFDVQLTTASGAATLAAETVNILEFEAGDTIQFKPTDTGAGGIVLTDTARQISYGTGSVLDALKLATTASGSSSSGTLSEITWFVHGSDSYVVYNTGTTDTVTSDVLVKLEGIKITGLDINAATGEVILA